MEKYFFLNKKKTHTKALQLKRSMADNYLLRPNFKTKKFSFNE